MVLTCVAVSVYVEALEENVENSLIGLEMVAGGVGKARVAGKYEFDSDQRK